MEIDFGGKQALAAGTIIGIIGDSKSGIAGLMRGVSGPAAAVNYTLDSLDSFAKAEGASKLESLVCQGQTVLLASHDEELLRRVADEVWWVREGRVEQKGDPGEVLDAYREHVASRLRESLPPGGLHPKLRRGDGRAELIELATMDAAGSAVGGWRSGEEAVIRITVRFHAAVADPVVGIMIRTRIGMEVYGTNTELEKVALGPCAEGDTRIVAFRFLCNLCPQTYTLTAASHDPDGVWHDWVEDAVAFAVTDSRYTAGVANLRARVTCSRG